MTKLRIEKLRIDPATRPGNGWVFKGYFYLIDESPLASAWMKNKGTLKVLRSISTMKDGSKWYHISISRPDKLPSWEDLTAVKNDFIGEEKFALQVIPAKEDHVNVNPFCLHLWSPYQMPLNYPNLKNITKEEAY
jgi:hypothetical protein